MKHNNCYVFVPMLLTSLCCASVAQAMDKQKWYDAKEIHYKITGEFNDRVSAGMSGSAQVTDRVVIEMTTDMNSTLIGDIKIENFPSTITDLQPAEKGCLPPELLGEYEHYTLTSIESMAEGNMQVSGANSVRKYPDMIISEFCTDRGKGEARTEENSEQFFLPMSGQFLMDPADFNSADRSVDPETGTLKISDKGWTWTYQATPK